MHLQASFKDFRIDALKYYECLILNKIRFAVTPQITPQAFSQELIILWRPDADMTAHLNLQESLISKFWEGKRWHSSEHNIITFLETSWHGLTQPLHFAFYRALVNIICAVHNSYCGVDTLLFHTARGLQRPSEQHTELLFSCSKLVRQEVLWYR